MAAAAVEQAIRPSGVLPLIVIAGPTASGKTALAVRLATQFGGEVICADSRTVYRDMDIGTAKPTASEQATVPHWGLDIASPGERFTVAQFQQYAQQKIAEIRARGRIPFLVGGTGLYIDAVIFDLAFAAGYDLQLRAKLQHMSLAQLTKNCIENNIPLPENSTNKRYIIRNVEKTTHRQYRPNRPIDHCIVVGIATKRAELRTRIARRAEQLFLNNVVEEAIILGKKYGWDNEAMTGNIYPIIHRYLGGKIDQPTMIEQFIVADWRLAKRQMTWLRRNPFLMWCTLSAAETYLSQLLVSPENL